MQIQLSYIVFVYNPLGFLKSSTLLHCTYFQFSACRIVNYYSLLLLCYSVLLFVSPSLDVISSKFKCSKLKPYINVYFIRIPVIDAMTLNVSKVVFKTSFWGSSLRQSLLINGGGSHFLINELFCIWNLGGPGMGAIKIIEIGMMRWYAPPVMIYLNQPPNSLV